MYGVHLCFLMEYIGNESRFNKLLVRPALSHFTVSVS